MFLILIGFSSKANTKVVSVPDLPQQTSGKKINFTENKGQVHDQNYKARPDVLFGGTDGSLVFHLKKDGVSYQLSKVNNWKEEETLHGGIRKSKITQKKA